MNFLRTKSVDETRKEDKQMFYCSKKKSLYECSQNLHELQPN